MILYTVCNKNIRFRAGVLVILLGTILLFFYEIHTTVAVNILIVPWWCGVWYSGTKKCILFCSAICSEKYLLRNLKDNNIHTNYSMRIYRHNNKNTQTHKHKRLFIRKYNM